ncbi:MAG: hypothetical protein ABI867_24115 [Kofleriaceae bacterium]
MTEEAAPEPELSTWDEFRKVRDQLKLELHLAGMEAREQWDKLQPKLVELEKSFEAGAHKAGSAMAEEAKAVGATLKKLLGDITSKKSD